MLSCGMKLLIFQQLQMIEFLQRQSLISRADDENNTFRFVKDLYSRSGFGDDSSIMNLIKY